MNHPGAAITSSEIPNDTVLAFLDSCFMMEASVGANGNAGNGETKPGGEMRASAENGPLRQLQESTQLLWDRMNALEQMLYMSGAAYGNVPNGLQPNGIDRTSGQEVLGREPKVKTRSLCIFQQF